MLESDAFFNDNYEESRERFRNSINEVKRIFPSASLTIKHVGDSNDDLTIDVIEANASNKHENLLIITTGLHGIEGYMGAAILQLFIREYLPLINNQDTGLLLVHSLNPWGMKHKRRVNENNVDLNRNFIYDWLKLDKNFNEQYSKATGFFNKKAQISSIIRYNLSYNLSLIKTLFILRPKGLSNAVLLGQYRYSNGIYYGGKNYEESTEYIIYLLRKYIKIYSNIVMIDIHTGYGPRNQMCIVNSASEEKSSEELSLLFSYPLVNKTDSKEFYAINGDMIDFVYVLQQNEFSSKKIYTTAFEFGTYGDSLMANLKSLAAIIKENQLFWYGTKNEVVDSKIKKNFMFLFYPSEIKWREKAIQDARQAFNGIFSAKNII